MRLLAAVAAASAAVVADEIVLIRLLSFRFWPHFVPLVISQAMLGLGGSGIALHLLRSRLARAPGKALAWILLAAAPACEAAFRASLLVPFDPFLLLWRPAAWPAFALVFLLLAVPFLLWGAAAGIPFVFAMERPGRVYAAGFAGSALGAAAAVCALGVVPTEYLSRVPLAIGAAGALVAAGDGRAFGLTRAGGALGSVLLLLLPAPDLRPSQYKDLSVILALPQARLLAVRPGVSGDHRALFSPGIHSAPGLSIRFEGEIPPQAVVLGDGELEGVVPKGGLADPPAYLDFLPSALPYRLLERPAVVQFGLRGTEGVLAALRGGAAEVTVVEPSGELVRLVGGDLASFSGGELDRPDVRIEREGPRAFLARAGPRFDLIEVAGISSAVFASVGVHAAGETYLLTREGVRAMLGRLSDRGLLCFTGWAKVPPRESIKVLRTVRAELERAGLGPAAERVIVLRGLGTFAVLAGRQPFDRGRMAAVRRFCRAMGFSLAWPREAGEEAGAGSDEERAFVEAVRAAVAGPGDPENGLFDLRPATDDAPYFHRFLRVASVPEFRRRAKAQWIPLVEWGIVFLLLSLAVSGVAAAACLLLPAALPRAGKGPGAPAAAYFGALGLGYMLLEIAFLKLGVLILGDPIRAAAWTIGAFCCLSGLGSARSARIEGGRAGPGWVFPAIAVAGAGGFLALAALAGRLLAAGFAARAAAFAASLACAAFLMGIPFPVGIARLSRRRLEGIPTAWAVNGFFSVLGASLAQAGALWVGFRVTVLCGALVYLLAGLLLPAVDPEISPASGPLPGAAGHLSARSCRR